MLFEETMQNSPAIQQLMLRAMTARNQLLTKISTIDLWMYLVETNMFYVVFKDGKGMVRHNSHPLDRNSNRGIRDEEQARKHPLSDESQERWVTLLNNLAVDSTLDEEGSIELDYKDHSRRIRTTYKVVKDEAGKIICVVGESEDISKSREKMQQVINEQNDYIRIINGFKASYDTIVYISLSDHSFTVLEATPQLRALGQQFDNARDFIAAVIRHTFKPQYQEQFARLAQLDDIRIILKDRKYVSYEYEDINDGWKKMRVMPAEYDEMGELTHIIVSTESTAEEHREKDQLLRLSEHDGLTGLFNRAAGVQRIEKLLLEESGMLALFDCDKFKSINDTYGHLVGDKVLVEIAATLQKVFKDQVLFRLGGDEFVVYITDSYFSHMAKEGFTECEVFDWLQQELSKIDIPEMCGQYPSISGGAARSSKECPVLFDELYKHADVALYQSKKFGRKKVTMINYTIDQ